MATRLDCSGGQGQLWRQSFGGWAKRAGHGGDEMAVKIGDADVV
jgi:hypothetical protein